jgi:hypothetical protein
MTTTVDDVYIIEIRIVAGQRPARTVLDAIVRSYWKFALLPGRIPTLQVKFELSTDELCHVIAVLDDLASVSATEGSLELGVEIDGVKLLVQLDRQQMMPQ